MNKILVSAGAACVCVGIGALVTWPDPQLLDDYPKNLIEHIAKPTPELSRFIDAQSRLEKAWTQPGGRLRVDPRIRGIKSTQGYLVTVTKAKDGDTISVVFHTGECGWLPCSGSKGDIRIWAIDSGETRLGKSQSHAGCENEISAGRIAKKFAETELIGAHEVWAYNLRDDPYAHRWVASIMYRPKKGELVKYFHVEALQYLQPTVRGNIYAFYDPVANKVLKSGGKTGFGKRKIWCDQAEGS